MTGKTQKKTEAEQAEEQAEAERINPLLAEVWATTKQVRIHRMKGGQFRGKKYYFVKVIQNEKTPIPSLMAGVWRRMEQLGYEFNSVDIDFDKRLNAFFTKEYHKPRVKA